MTHFSLVGIAYELQCVLLAYLSFLVSVIKIGAVETRAHLRLDLWSQSVFPF